MQVRRVYKNVRGGLLLKDLLQKIQLDAKASRQTLSKLLNQVQTTIASNKVLLNGVQKQVPLTIHKDEEICVKIPQRVQGYGEVDYRKRWGLFKMPLGQAIKRSPSRWGQAQQQTKLSHNNVQELPYGNAYVVGVQECTDRESVYDIQTESNHNFFANGALVHNCFILDDVVRNALDAMNEANLEAYWTWFRDTLFTRTDGDDYKFISVMQRWAKRDLSGHIIEFFGDDVEVIDYNIETDGKILDETIVSRDKLNTIKKTLSPEIYSANYMQEPIDIKGRLFDDLEEYDSIPQSNEPVKAYVDTADTGTDYFCGMAYKYIDGKVYILPEIVFTQDSAEATEPMTAKMLTVQEVSVATFESNNGGRMFARNIERIMQENGNRKTVVEWKPTTSNKEARILSNSAWVQHNIYMPKGWKSLYPEMATQILSYVKGGKNKHDDAIDVLVAIAESCNSDQVEYLDASELF